MAKRAYPWWKHKAHRPAVYNGQNIAEKCDFGAVRGRVEAWERHARTYKGATSLQEEVGNALRTLSALRAVRDSGPSVVGQLENALAVTFSRLHAAEEEIKYLNSQVLYLIEVIDRTEEILDEKGIIWHSEDGDSHAGPERFDEPA